MKKKEGGYQKGMCVLVCSAHVPTSGVLMPGKVVRKTSTCVEIEFTYRSFFRDRTKRMWFTNSDVFGEVEE